MYLIQEPTPVAAWSKKWVCYRSLSEIAGSNPAGGHGYLSLECAAGYQVEVSGTC